MPQVGEDVLVLVCACLSPVDLVRLSEVNHAWCDLTRANNLWRALFLTRFGPDGIEAAGCENYALNEMPDGWWLSHYKTCDERELRSMASGGMGELDDIYAQMVRAKREQPMGPALRAQLTSQRPSGAAHHLLKWRQARGLPPHSNVAMPNLAASTFAKFGDVYVCERTGWQHVCGEACAERLLDQQSGQFVCPVSGRMFNRVLYEAEVEGVGGEDEDADYRGRLGRAFVQGYYCDDAGELDDLFG